MKIVFMDLDGTLFTDDKRISPKDLDAINRAMDAGHKMVFNTGRPIMSVLPTAEEYGLDRAGFLISSFNGGLIYDCGSRSTLMEHHLDMGTVRYFMDEAVKSGLHCHTYSETNVISEKDTKELEFYTKRIKVPGLVTDDFTKAVSKPPIKIIVMCLEGRERLEKFRREHEDYARDLYTTFSDDRLLEYSHRLTNKGEAVRFLCDHLGIAREDSIGIGDEENDLPMIEAAGIGVCMKNGSALLMEKAGYVTEHTNNGSGVAEVIEKFVL